jgi:putative ABC transport system permease protein
MEQWLSLASAQPRLNAELLVAFAAVALLIAVIGIYGVLSYPVSRRTREIGLRPAIGAQPAGVLRLIVRQGMAVELAGIGAVLAAVLAVVAALAACYLPARRAARVDPIIALREE